MWMPEEGGADLLTYHAMPADVPGGQLAGGDSEETKKLAERIYTSLTQHDADNGTTYATNLSTNIYESDEPKWVKARRELIERAAMNERPRPTCASRGLVGGGGDRHVRFAENRDVKDFFQDAPVLSGGSSSSPVAVTLQGVRLEAVAPVIFAAGASNCKSDPGFRWTPGGSGGPDGMGYCPHDYEPGTVLPGFDGGLYKVAVGRDGSRVWTSAGDAPVTYRVVPRPQGADGMGLLDGVGLGDYDTYSWPAHVPKAWTSYGYRRNCNAYSFLPNHMHHSILRYLVDGRLDRSATAKLSGMGGVGEAEAKQLVGDFGKNALALVSSSTSIMFNRDHAYLGKTTPADPPAATGTGTSSTATVPKVYQPNGAGILAASESMWFVGTFAKASKWGELKGGEESFKGWKLEVGNDTVTATHGSVTGDAFVATAPERKLEVKKATELTESPKVEGVEIEKGAQTAYVAGDASGYAFELRRLANPTGGASPDLWLRFGKCGTKAAVQEGWMCKVGQDKDTGLAVKFKLDGKGQTQVTHIYAGKVDGFGMPHGPGVLQQVGADVATTEQRGEFRLGQLVLGSCGTKQEGFFLDGVLYGDAKFRDAVFTTAKEKSVEAKKHVDGKKNNFATGLASFNTAVNPVTLTLAGGASRAARPAARPVPVPVPQDDLAMFGGGGHVPLDVKGGLHGLHGMFPGPAPHGPAPHVPALHMPALHMPGANHVAPMANAAAPRELLRGQVDGAISRQVQAAQMRLRDLQTAGADARLVAELQGYAELLFGKGEEFVHMENALPASSTDAAAVPSAAMEKRKADLVRVLQDVVRPCATLVHHKESPHAWVRQYVRMLSLKILALVQYVCSSERTGVSELCKLRESVERCLAFALVSD